jgi:hypothetical protein
MHTHMEFVNNTLCLLSLEGIIDRAKKIVVTNGARGSTETSDNIDSNMPQMVDILDGESNCKWTL